MSETHLNAFALELQEKRAELAALQSEVDRLDKIVNPVEEAPAEDETPQDKSEEVTE